VATKNVSKSVRQKLPFGPGMFAMTVLSTGYTLKCYYNIKSFLNTHHNAIEGHISAAQANAPREHEKKTCTSHVAGVDCLCCHCDFGSIFLPISQ